MGPSWLWTLQAVVEAQGSEADLSELIRCGAERVHARTFPIDNDDDVNCQLQLICVMPWLLIAPPCPFAGLSILVWLAGLLCYMLFSLQL